MTQRYNTKQSGFTLVELMLAMTFIAFMLVAIALTVIQINNMYTRGITMRQVNQAGRTVVADMQRSIAESVAFSPETRFIQNNWGGRLCTGRYSYIWNTAERINEGMASGTNLNRYAGGSSNNRLIRLVRVIDNTEMYCINPSQPINTAQAVELLDEGDRPLAIHNISLRSTANAFDAATQQRLYTISFALGTDNTDAIITGNETCRDPSEVLSQEEFCSINRFTFTATAGIR